MFMALSGRLIQNTSSSFSPTNESQERKNVSQGLFDANSQKVMLCLPLSSLLLT
jgi:hypothetical protein